MQPEILIEEVDLQSIDNLILSEGANKPKSYVIKGPFLEANIKNKNKRVYPSPIIKPQIEAYQKEIEIGRSVGELNHPNTLEIDPKNISHKIRRLEFIDDNIVEGEAIVGSTPNGMIVRALMDDKIKLGVSSRGAGSLKEGIVQKDFRYVCNDIVWEPSAPSAFVEGILEAKTEWVVENGILTEKEIVELQDNLANFNGRDINTVLLEVFALAIQSAGRNGR